MSLPMKSSLARKPSLLALVITLLALPSMSAANGREEPGSLVAQVDVIGWTPEGQACVKASDLDALEPSLTKAELAKAGVLLFEGELASGQKKPSKGDPMARCSWEHEVQAPTIGEAWIGTKKKKHVSLEQKHEGDWSIPERGEEDEAIWEKHECSSISQTCYDGPAGSIYLKVKGRSYRLLKLGSSSMTGFSLRTYGTSEERYLLVSFQAMYDVLSMCPHEEHKMFAVVDLKEHTVQRLHHGYGNAHFLWFSSVEEMDPLHEIVGNGLLPYLDEEELENPEDSDLSLEPLSKLKRHYASLRTLISGSNTVVDDMSAIGRFKALRRLEIATTDANVGASLEGVKGLEYACIRTILEGERGEALYEKFPSYAFELRGHQICRDAAEYKEYKDEEALHAEKAQKKKQP